MKATIYKKRMEWNGIAANACSLLFFFVLLMQSNDIGVKEIYFALLLLAYFPIMIILYFAGFLYYRLSIEEDRIIEKRLFHKARTILWRDVDAVIISLRGIIKVKAGDEQIYICCMKDMDAIWLDLKERVGEEKIEFITHKLS